MKTSTYTKWSIGLLTLLIFHLGVFYPGPAAAAAGTSKIVPISSLDLTKIAMTDLPGAALQRPLSIGGKPFNSGIWMKAHGFLHIQLDGHGRQFTAQVGVDDSVKGQHAAVNFYVQGDGRDLWTSGVMKPGDPAKSIAVNVSGVKILALLALPCDRNYVANVADWAQAQVETDGALPQTVLPVREAPYLLTPPPSTAPRINSPRIYGARPGHPFLFLLPVSGERPMHYTAKGLPRGLTLKASTGIIGGVAKKAGTYHVKITASNRFGKAESMLRLVIGDSIALTPPMGFNDWYCYGFSVDEKAMRAAAQAMASSGMSQYGYSYVDIDDCWAAKPGAGYSVLVNDKLYADPRTIQGLIKSLKLMPGAVDPAYGEPRDAKGEVNANPHSFPNMKAMTDEIHGLGLKAGIYSSPGPLTCAGFVGSFLFEDQDARRFAEWGFDFLKYDWCYYGLQWAPKDPTLEQMKRPFIRMSQALSKQPRDIAFNFCQYGLGNVWQWGKAAGGNSWRTANDLGAAFNGNSLYSNLVSIAFSESGLEQWAGPGHWNDPDYLILSKNFGLSPNEEYSNMTFWSLLCAPLFYGGRMDQLDPFTLNVLCNAEVIEVNQDPLGQQAKVVTRDGYRCILTKDMEDGSKAVGLFNIGEFEANIQVQWKDVGLSGPAYVRDLWRQKDLGLADGHFALTVPRHGVALLRLSKVK